MFFFCVRLYAVCAVSYKERRKALVLLKHWSSRSANGDTSTQVTLTMLKMTVTGQETLIKLYALLFNTSIYYLFTIFRTQKSAQACGDVMHTSDDEIDGIH